jgi:hypothetical protein
MSTAIFTFDHTQEKINKALGVNESYMDDLNSKTKDIIFELKVDEENKNMKDCTASQMIEAALHEYSYSQLVILAGFYLRDKIESMEEQALEKYMKGDMTGIPKDLIDKIKGSRSSMSIDGDSLPPGLRDALENLVKGLSELREQQEEEDDDED